MIGPDTVAYLRALVAGTASRPTEGPGAGPPDWGYVARFLVHHAMAGLALAERGGPATDGGMPDAVVQALRGPAAATALRGEVTLDAARRARAALHAASVPSLVFKGAALRMDGTYATPAERALEDADLLVARADAEPAVRALQSAGFRPWIPWDRRLPGWLPSFTLDGPGDPSGETGTVDLHWSTAYASLRAEPAAASDPLWEGADRDRGLPCPEAHFVLLCDHFLKHLRVVRHLRGLGDLARLAPRLRDPAALLAHARRRGSERRVAMLLAVLNEGYRVPVAASVLGALPDRHASPSALRLVGPDRLLGSIDGSSGRIGGLIARWRVEGLDAAGVLREVRDVAHPPEAWLRARYADDGSLARLRARHGLSVAAWLLRLAPSPLSPNQ